jgi:V/A-type H+-transporting ATPase subunit E
MAIIDLTTKILDEAKKRAAEIKADSSEKTAEIEHETASQVVTLTETATAQTDKLLADNERRVISTAQQEAKMELDRAKRESLETVFSAAKKELAGLDGAKYEAFVAKLLGTLPKDVTGTLLTSPKREKETQTALTAAGLSLTLATDDSLEGGFLVRGDDFEYNYTFEKILADKKSELEIGVATILFD